MFWRQRQLFFVGLHIFWTLFNQRNTEDEKSDALWRLFMIVLLRKLIIEWVRMKLVIRKDQIFESALEWWKTVLRRGNKHFDLCYVLVKSFLWCILEYWSSCRQFFSHSLNWLKHLTLPWGIYMMLKALRESFEFLLLEP